MAPILRRFAEVPSSFVRGFLRPFADTMTSALTTLGRNKLRSALTLLGIVIGVVAVIAMSATIEGLRTEINNDLSQLGSGVFQVQKEPVGFGPRQNRAKIEKRKNFTVAEVELLENECERCLRVAGEVWDPPRTVTGNGKSTVRPVAIVGGTQYFFDNNGFTLDRGRLFGDGEARSNVNLLVIGPDLADALFGALDPIGQEVRIANRMFVIVGLLDRRGSNMGGSIDNIAVMPIGAFLTYFGAKQSLNVTIQSKDPGQLERTQDEVVSILRRARGVAPQDENDFEMFSNSSMQDAFEEMTGSIAFASIGICAISLLIGGIGVMNIMLVAVTERTGEIGVRRALGARRRRILSQFVLEAVMLTSVGGLIGVIMGSLIAALVEVMVGIPTAVPMWAVALSMIGSGGTGLVFGIYPAFRASRLDPVEAMRHE
jgi:putative ABC transport system permease protein